MWCGKFLPVIPNETLNVIPNETLNVIPNKTLNVIPNETLNVIPNKTLNVIPNECEGSYHEDRKLKLIKSMAAAFSTYSRIPMPHFELNESDMSYSLIFFPFVGALIGAVVLFINAFTPLKALPAAVRIILTILAPLVITGGFHVDGLMDTEDALNSCAPMEKKLEILKDPHIGAFAVISLVKWMLLYSAAVTALLLNEKTDIKIQVIFGLTFVLSRVLSGLTGLVFKKAKNDGMLYEETKNNRKAVLVCLVAEGVICAGVMLVINSILAAAVLSAFALAAVYYRYSVCPKFGGVTGDTAGYFLCVSETVSAAALAAILYVL